MIRSLLRLSLALALVLFAGACRHPGMMFLCLSVTRGGEPLAEVWFDASDSSDVDEIWAEAGKGGRGIFLEALLQAEKPSPAAPYWFARSAACFARTTASTSSST